MDGSQRIDGKYFFPICHMWRDTCRMNYRRYFTKTCGMLHQLFYRFSAAGITWESLSLYPFLLQGCNGMLQLFYRTSHQNDILCLSQYTCSFKAHTTTAPGNYANRFHKHDLTFQLFHTEYFSFSILSSIMKYMLITTINIMKSIG